MVINLGEVRMFSQLFGAYLVEKNIISEDVLKSIISEQSTARVKLGTIAVAEGLLTQNETQEINRLQTQYDKRFGDIAVEKDYLTKAQVDDLLSKQGNAFMKFLQLLVEKNCFEVSKLDTYLSDFQKNKGFTDEEMKSLKSDDIDKIVPLYAVSSKPYVTDLVALVLRNITRFVSTDFYIGTMKRVERCAYKSIAGQETIGDHAVYLAVMSEKEDRGLLSLASDFAHEKLDVVDSYTFDTITEFVNICSGLFATNMGEKNINVDMRPPFAYVGQEAEGEAYVIPVYIHGNEFKIFVAVDNEVKMGTKPFGVAVEKCAGSKVTDESRGTVVVVDDSALMRKMLRNMIESDGYTVVCEAVNGQEAVDVYKEYKPDIITLDITMPIMDGVEALKQIMEYDPKANAVMITAAGQQKKVIEALKIGASKFIMKPLNKDEVLSDFKEVMGELI
jgi:CheY-like chemotaxis protein